MNAVAALLSAVCVSVLTAIALAFPLGGLNPLIAAAALGAGTATGVLQYGAALRARTAPRPAFQPGAWGWAAIVVYTLFSLRAFCWLVFYKEDSIDFISSNNLGDLSLHLTYINNLANGVPFWPENPIFEGTKLHYPLGVDIFNSLLKLAGMDVYRGLVCVGLVAALITGIALYKWGRGFAIAGFLFNGGLAGFQFFQHFELADYQDHVAWKSIPLAMFVTQRGLLYAVPAGLALLWSWRARFFPGKPNEEKPLPLHVEILLYSTMPLFHFHTFIFLSLLLGCWIVTAMARNVVDDAAPGVLSGLTLPLVKLVAWSVIPASVLTWLITGFGGGSIVHFVHGGDWMYDDHPAFSVWAHGLHLPSLLAAALGHATWWVVNFGALPFFVLLLITVLAFRRGEAAFDAARAFVFPSVAIFILSCFVMFATWDWDNTKLMLWSYLVVQPFLWDRFLAKEPLPVRGMCCILLYFSGFISLLGGIDNTHDGYELASRTEMDGVASAVRTLPVTAIFAGVSNNDSYNHPLLLNGRNMVAGYPGHLSSYGIDYEQQKELLEKLLSGEADWRPIAQKLHVRYIFWGKREEEEYPDSAVPWRDECRKVAEGSWGAIYDLDAPIPTAPAANP